MLTSTKICSFKHGPFFFGGGGGGGYLAVLYCRLILMHYGGDGALKIEWDLGRKTCYACIITQLFSLGMCQLCYMYVCCECAAKSTCMVLCV